MRRVCYLLAALGLIAAAGCELPVSVHPLSDEKTSKIDERLIGTWEHVPKAGEERGANAVPPRWLIGRMAGKENLHEVVVLELDGDGHAQVQRLALMATQVGELRYVSILANPTEPKEKQAYFLLCYEFVDENTVRFTGLNKDVVAPAIDREELKGVVRKSPPDPNAPPQEQVKPKYKEIRITAEPTELRAWFAKQGKAALAAESMTTIRRVEVQQ
jgi:hypothetical protein